MASCWLSAPSGAQPAQEGDIWFLRMDRPAGEAFQIPGVGGAPIFSPDNRWIAFLKRTPPPRNAHEPAPLERQLEQRFKGRIYDWMNVKADGRGFLPDPRDPAATPPNELYIVARDGGAARATHASRSRRARARLAPRFRGPRLRRRFAPARRILLRARRPVDRRSGRPDPSPDRRRLRVRFARMVARRPLARVPPPPKSEPGHRSQAESRRGRGSVSHPCRRRRHVQPHRRLGSHPRCARLQPERQVRLLRRGRWAATRNCIACPQRAARWSSSRTAPRNLGGFTFSAAVRPHGIHRVGARDIPPKPSPPASMDGGEKRLSALNDPWIADVDLRRRRAHPVPQQRRHPRRRLDHAAARRQGAVPAGARHPRRTARRLWQRLRLRIPMARRQRLCRALYQSARQHRLWREVPVGHLGRLGQAGFRRRDGRRGLRPGSLPHRSANAWASPATPTAAF